MVMTRSGSFSCGSTHNIFRVTVVIKQHVYSLSYSFKHVFNEALACFQHSSSYLQQREGKGSEVRIL